MADSGLTIKRAKKALKRAASLLLEPLPRSTRRSGNLNQDKMIRQQTEYSQRPKRKPKQ
jgi:hypothetical protein